MSPKGLKVLFVCAEAAPFATVGGLAQVAYFLPRALKKLGIDVALFMPRYGTISEEKYHIEPLLDGLMVPTDVKDGPSELECNVKVRYGGRWEPTVYFLENHEFYEMRGNVYGYKDDPARFALLSRGLLEFVKAVDYRPQIIHANDWHTGYVANYLRRKYEKESEFRAISTVFTIHNLKNQGIFDFRYASPMDFDDGKSLPAPFPSEALRKQNALKRGIIYSDLVNTVSESYVREIMTSEYGEGLHDLIKELRDKFFGILNGLDYTDFNPSTDHVIKKGFSTKTVAARVENKINLQKEFGLEANPSVPLLSYVGRLAEQKGMELMKEVLPSLLKEFPVQVVVLGTGESRYRDFFANLEKEYPGRVGCHLLANFTLPRKIFAGSDILILPSRFEPAGIVVMEGMRYGAVPVVRRTGGLSDIVNEYNPQDNSGNGFSFHSFTPLSFFGAVVRALEVYKNKKSWHQLVSRVIREDFSWDKAAVRYADLYERAIEFRRDRQNSIIKPTLI